MCSAFSFWKWRNFLLWNSVKKWGSIADRCGTLSQSGETLLQTAGRFPEVGKHCCKWQDTFPNVGNVAANCGTTSQSCESMPTKKAVIQSKQRTSFRPDNAQSFRPKGDLKSRRKISCKRQKTMPSKQQQISCYRSKWQKVQTTTDFLLNARND